MAASPQTARVADEKSDKVKPGDFGGGWLEKCVNVTTLEFTLINGTSFLAMNRDGKTIDSYAILWLASRPKEQHKSKIQKKTTDPHVCWSI